MERLLGGEQHFRDPFSDPEASSLGVSRRRSDVDFGDVFGGPPRNPSVYDLRRSLGESVSGCGGFGGEEAGRSRRHWSSLGEKPVFGLGFGSPSPRKKDFGEDFFSDIFRGGDSAFSSPRRLEWERMSSTSSSRVLSPVRSLPPSSAGFGGSSSLPSQLSFSKKMAKGLENPLFVPSPDNSLYKSEGSDLVAGVNMPTIAPHVTENRDDFKTNAHGSFHRSSFSHDQDLSPKTIPPAGIGIGGNFKEDSIGSRASTVGQFHFSIYKWASKGVMLVVPSNSKERTKNESRHGGLPVLFLQGVDVPSSNKLMPTFFPSEVENQHSSLSSELGTPRKTTIDSVKNLEKSLPKKFQPISLPTSIIPEPGSVAENPQAVSGIVYGTGTSTKINEEVPVFMQEPHNPITWNLQDMVDDHYGRDGIQEKDDNKQDEEKADLVSCTTSTRSADSSVEVKRKTGKMSVIHQPNAQDIPIALKEKMPNGRVRGKVKEFIKIFNKELSGKSGSIIESQPWDPKVKDFGRFKVEERVKPHATNTTEEEKLYGNYSGEQSDAPFTVEQVLKEEKLHSDMDSDVVNDNESSHVKEEASKPCFESTQVSSKASFDIAEEPHYEVEEFQVEYILQEQNELPQANSDLEDIQNLDAKIRAWSAGKEGNIRSMLSTLQYVLWTGSGWKPVPLVDIIEGSSVKRAYQKALLCLHPDKLQQRGAPLHQKYIAEKVFSIVQEAWDHFHTSSTL